MLIWKFHRDDLPRNKSYNWCKTDFVYVFVLRDNSQKKVYNDGRNTHSRDLFYYTNGRLRNILHRTRISVVF